MSSRLFRLSFVFTVFVLTVFTAPLAIAGIVLPAKDSTAAFGNNYGLGFSNGDLYLHTGDSIYVLQDDGAGGQTFNLHMSGLESAFTGFRRAFEGTFATAPNGQALVSMGFTDGGVLLIDLAAKTSRVVPDFDGDGQDNDNIFSAAGRSDGTFFANWVSPAFFPVDATKVYRIDPVTLGTALVKDVNPGKNSGGMAFDSHGNLIAGTFEPQGTFPDPVGTASYFRIAADQLDQANPQVDTLGTGSANGNAFVATDADDNVYFNTTTGIGVLRAGETVAQNFFGDITDPNLFFTPQITLEGLAFDPLTNSLFFAQKFSNGFELVSLVVPEPGTASIVFMLATAMAVQLRRRKA